MPCFLFSPRSMHPTLPRTSLLLLPLPPDRLALFSSPIRERRSHHACSREAATGPEGKVAFSSRATSASSPFILGRHNAIEQKGPNRRSRPRPRPRPSPSACGTPFRGRAPAPAPTDLAARAPFAPSIICTFEPRPSSSLRLPLRCFFAAVPVFLAIVAWPLSVSLRPHGLPTHCLLPTPRRPSPKTMRSLTRRPCPSALPFDCLRCGGAQRHSRAALAEVAASAEEEAWSARSSSKEGKPIQRVKEGKRARQTAARPTARPRTATLS